MITIGLFLIGLLLIILCGIIDLLPYLIVLVAVTYCIGHIVEKINKK